MVASPREGVFAGGIGPITNLRRLHFANKGWQHVFLSSGLFVLDSFEWGQYKPSNGHCKRGFGKLFEWLGRAALVDLS